MRCSTLIVFLAAITITAATLAFAQTQSSPPSYRFSSGSAALDIPVELVANGLIFVHAKVNGHPGCFLLDNASQGFIADRDYARQISLQSSGNYSSRGGGAGQIQAKAVHDVRISLPGLDLTHRNLIVIPLRTLEPTLGHTLDGIIGSRLFDDFVVTVDYEHRSISVATPGQHQPSKDETAIPITVDEHGFQYIQAEIALPGVAPTSATFLVDGGANTYADIYKPFADAQHLPPPSMKLMNEPGTSTGGKTESRVGRASRISIGPYSISNPTITFASDTEGLMAVSNYAGLIGTEFLQRFTVVFDNSGKKISLKPNRHYGDTPLEDESGLRIRAEGRGFHRFVVGRVVPQSPAAGAGINTGDIIESINNRPADRLTLTEVRNIFSEPHAHPSVGIRREGRHLRFALALHPLL